MPTKQAAKILGKLTVCSRGHKFEKTKNKPTCPVCWPGRYK